MFFLTNETYRFVDSLFNDPMITSDYAALNCTMNWEVSVCMRSCLISGKTAQRYEEFRGDWGQYLNVGPSEYEVILLYITYLLHGSESFLRS